MVFPIRRSKFTRTQAKRGACLPSHGDGTAMDSRKRTDILSEEERSERMSRVRQEDTKPELIVRKYLFAKGFRYRKNDRRYPGSPDVVLPKYRTVIFTHGCFWHGHTGCRAARLPRTRHEFWARKVADNRSRDARNTRLLEQDGWNVIVVWECELKGKKRRRHRLETLAREIDSCEI